MPNIKLNDVVMLRDLSGFTDRTVGRFTGKCCDVVSLERGMSGWNAQIRIKGSKPGESFTSLNVRTDRLIKIEQMAPGTKPALAAANDDVYNVAPLIGPIPSDDWAYSVLPTLSEALVREVVEYRLPGTAQCSRAFPYLRKTEIGVWMYADTQKVYENAMERFGAVQGAAKGTRWLYFTNDNTWLNQQEWLNNYHGSFVPALTWPSMGKHLESAFNHGIENS